jgi:hypothetical protein
VERAEFPRWPAAYQVQQLFGSWSAAVAAAGVDAAPRLWSQKEVIDVAQQWARLHGRAPRCVEWRRVAGDASRPTDALVIELFGSWNAMLAAAGLPIAHRAWSREQTLAALATWIGMHGQPPTASDWAHSHNGQATHPSASWVHECFGSWNAMLAAGGVQPRFRFWTEPEILAVCADFERRVGRPIRARDFHDPHHGLPSINTVRRKIGDTSVLRRALRSSSAAGSDPRAR